MAENELKLDMVVGGIDWARDFDNDRNGFEKEIMYSRMRAFLGISKKRLMLRG